MGDPGIGAAAGEEKDGKHPRVVRQLHASLDSEMTAFPLKAKQLLLLKGQHRFQVPAPAPAVQHLQITLMVPQFPEGKKQQLLIGIQFHRHTPYASMYPHLRHIPAVSIIEYPDERM